jgi:hypothetical protein
LFFAKNLNGDEVDFRSSKSDSKPTKIYFYITSLKQHSNNMTT